MHAVLVKDWMTPEPLTISPTTSLPEALGLMQTRHIRRLPVMDQARLIGIVTLGDLRAAQPSAVTSVSLYELRYLVNRITVQQVMTANPVTVPPTATVADAARLMLQRKIAGLPVVDADRLVGILTESDIFRLVVALWAREAAQPLVVDPRPGPAVRR